MNRRTLLKGLASLPLLRHLDLSLSTPAEAAPIEEEVKESIDWPKHASWPPSNRFSYLDGGTLDLGVIRDAALCAPILPTYDFFMEEWERPIRDSLPAIKASRGGIRYFKPE
jgi:hypothetical protein